MTPLPLPLRVENVKIRENSDKNQGTPSLRPFLGFGVFGAVELLKGGLGNLKVKNIYKL